jgi:hypothetical protein
MGRDTLVDAFIAAADEKYAVELRKASRSFLIKKFSGSGEEHNGGFWIWRDRLHRVSNAVSQERLDGFEKWRRLENHAFTTAEWTIVHSAMAVFGECPQILDIYFDQSCFACATENTVVERSGEKFRKDGDEVEAHALPV